jgi:hypothetical protein
MVIKNHISEEELGFIRVSNKIITICIFENSSHIKTQNLNDLIEYKMLCPA